MLNDIKPGVSHVIAACTEVCDYNIVLDVT